MIDHDTIRECARLTYERFRCRIPHDCVQRSHAPAEKLIPIGFVSLSIRVSSLALSVSGGNVASACVCRWLVPPTAPI